MSRKKSKEQFIAESKRVHGDRYDYSLVQYVDANTKVCIVCPIHGEFWQRPNDHIRGIGCKKCSYDKKGKADRMEYCDFLKRARMTHGNKYQYNENSFIGSHFGIIINCPIHGVFTQRAESHIRGQGCPKCALLERHKKVHGKGINDLEVNTKKDISYRVWNNMLNRSINERTKDKMPTYEGVSVCDEWLIYSNFKSWFYSPENGYIEGYSLDKDILVKGNKIYSPDTCCFVPQEINTLFINRRRFRGEYPIGVSKSTSGRYKSTVNCRNTRINIGTFDTIEEAFNAYKEAKESIIRQIANEYYVEGLITEKVYNAMLAYRIELGD